MAKESQTSRILKLLQKKKVVTNVELNRICFRYGARIYELRHEGHQIQTRRVKGGRWQPNGLFEFVYLGHVDDGVRELAEV